MHRLLTRRKAQELAAGRVGSLWSEIFEIEFFALHWVIKIIMSKMLRENKLAVGMSPNVDYINYISMQQTVYKAARLVREPTNPG